MSEHKPALIECLIRRDGGSKVHLDDLIYTFSPDRTGRHVAIVTDPSHVEKLQSITDAYQLLDYIEDENVPATAELAPAARQLLNFAAQQDTRQPEAGPETALADIISQLAPQKVVAAKPAPMSAPVAPQAPVIVAQPTTLAALPVVVDGEEPTAEQLSEIRAIFEAELGEKPHHKKAFDTMASQIEAMRAERAAATGA